MAVDRVGGRIFPIEPNAGELWADERAVGEGTIRRGCVHGDHFRHIDLAVLSAPVAVQRNRRYICRFPDDSAADGFAILIADAAPPSSRLSQMPLRS